MFDLKAEVYSSVYELPVLPYYYCLLNLPMPSNRRCNVAPVSCPPRAVALLLQVNQSNWTAA